MSIFNVGGAIGAGLGGLVNSWPVLSRDGIYTTVTRTNPRQTCENPLLGIIEHESPLPCIELSYGALLDLRKNYKEYIIETAGITENDWRSYFNALFDGFRLLLGLIAPDSDVCPGWESELNNLFGKDYLTLKTLVFGAMPLTNQQKLQLISGIVNRRAKEFYSKYSESYAKNLAIKAYPVEKRVFSLYTGQFEPTCNSYKGMCCLYNEYIETVGTILPEKKKNYKVCDEDSTKSDCMERTKRYGGVYDGYEFYAKTNKVTCSKCSNAMYHIVYCANGSPFLISNLDLDAKQAWYKDNDENISSGYYNDIVEFVDKLFLAEDELRKRQDTEQCGTPEPVTTTPTTTTTPTPTPTTTPTSTTATPTTTTPTTTTTTPTPMIMSWLLPE